VRNFLLLLLPKTTRIRLQIRYFIQQKHNDIDKKNKKKKHNLGWKVRITLSLSICDDSIFIGLKFVGVGPSPTPKHKE